MAQIISATKNMTGPFRIVSIYLMVGSLWILLSDRILEFIFQDPDIITQLQTFKGWFYVIGTGYMLYLLMKKDMKLIQQSKDEILESEERYRLIIGGTTDGFWDWDITTENFFLSSQWKTVLGYEAGETQDDLAFWQKIVHPEDWILIKEAAGNYLKKNTHSLKTEIRVINKNGDIRWILTKGQAVWDEGGNPIRLVGTITDITERKITEEALNSTMDQNKKLLNEVIKYDKLKTEFFSNISHEFRTPLNVILGTLQLVDIYIRKCNADTECGSKIKRHLGIMKQNCYRLLRLINNLIDITRIDSGFMQTHLKNQDIVKIIEDITLSVVEYVGNKSVTLTFNSDIKEKIIACDADMIERIILNLLSNSMKYTPSGGKIEVRIYEKEGNLLIAVKDTGIGIPEDKLSMIFERFRQVNASLTRDREGSGIGLTLVKSIVQMHGGDIWAKSNFGAGSEFVIKLPVKLLMAGDLDTQSDKIDTGKVESVERVERAKIEFSDIYIAQ